MAGGGSERSKPEALSDCFARKQEEDDKIMDSKIIFLMQLLLLRAYFLRKSTGIFGVGLGVYRGWSFRADHASLLDSSRRLASAEGA